MPGTNKQRVWTFSKKSNRLKLLCNGEQIFDFNYADSNIKDCRNNWNLDFGHMEFASTHILTDTASDSYRTFRTGMWFTQIFINTQIIIIILA
jgi:hypothetical protein